MASASVRRNCGERVRSDRARASASRSAGGLVQPLVVGVRVRVGPDDAARARAPGPFAARARTRPPRAWPVAGDEIGAVAPRRLSGRETTRTSREMSPPGVCTSTGHRNGVAVVFDEEDDRQPARCTRCSATPRTRLRSSRRRRATRRRLSSSCERDVAVGHGR